MYLTEEILLFEIIAVESLNLKPAAPELSKYPKPNLGFYSKYVTQILTAFFSNSDSPLTFRLLNLA